MSTFSSTCICVCCERCCCSLECNGVVAAQFGINFSASFESPYKRIVQGGLRRLAQLLQAAVALLDNAELDAAAGQERDSRLVARTDHEDVLQARGERVVVDVLDVDNVKLAGMTLAADNVANTASVTAGGEGDQAASVELEELDNLARLQVELDGVVGLNGCEHGDKPRQKSDAP